MSYRSGQEQAGMTCPQCQGTGKVMQDEGTSEAKLVPCVLCGGAGMVSRQRFRQWQQEQDDKLRRAQRSQAKSSSNDGEDDETDPLAASRASEEELNESERQRREEVGDDDEELERTTKCPRCRGIGRIVGPTGDMVPCSLCGGTKVVGVETRKAWAETHGGK